ncbi:MAG TPA: hypothetical protein VIO61_15355 [Anaerolineaceae bacterium]
MTTKTFRGSTMIQVLKKVQQELGSDAVVISVRQSPGGAVWQVWKKPVFEVIAMSKSEQPASAKSPAQVQTGESKIAGVQKPVIASPGQPDSLAKDKPRASTPAGAMSKEKPQNDPASPPTATPFIPYFQGKASRGKDEPILSEVDSEDDGVSLDISTSSKHPAPEAARHADVQPVALKPAAKEDEGRQNFILEYQPDFPPMLAKWRKKLIEQGLDAGLVEKICGVTAATLSPRAMDIEESVKIHLAKQLEVGLRTFPNGRLPAFRVLCLVGASGSGKTSTCAKLLAYYTRRKGLRAAWISLDTVRANALAEARLYADLLGIPFHPAYTGDELIEILDHEKNMDFVVVDTPGCNPYRESQVVDLVKSLSKVPNRTAFLTAPATTKEVDLKQSLVAFAPLRLKGIVVTKLDETQTFGAVYNLIWRSQIPIGAITTGKDVMEDLRPGSVTELVSGLFGEILSR